MIVSNKPMVMVWSDVVTLAEAAQYLSHTEQQCFLKLNIRRQALWLKGRCAAKYIIQKVVQDKTNKSIDFRQIEIIGVKGQSPLFRLRGEHSGFDSSAYSLSISHTEATAVATLSRIRHHGRVGIDIEQARCFSEHFARAFLTDYEYKQSLLLGQAYMVQCWCYKEAFLKATGTGLKVHPRRLETVIGRDGRLCGLRKDGEVVPVVARSLQLPGVAFGAIVYAPSYGPC